jgi:hypothetical protein
MGSTSRSTMLEPDDSSISSFVIIYCLLYIALYRYFYTSYVVDCHASTAW